MQSFVQILRCPPPTVPYLLQDSTDCIICGGEKSFPQINLTIKNIYLLNIWNSY